MSAFDSAQSNHDNMSPDDEDDRQSRRDRRRQYVEDHADEILESRREARDHAKEWGGCDYP